VPLSYKAEDGYKLGRWVTNQRVTKDGMTLDRRQRLEGLPGWSWNVFSDKWEEGFSHLKEFFRTTAALQSIFNLHDR
jgi:hypothetical protein